MRLHNHTNLRAGLFRGDPHPEHMVATVVVHVEHAAMDGVLQPAGLIRCAVGSAPAVTELDDAPVPAMPAGGGTSFWLIGVARPPAATAEMIVELAVGPRARRLVVVGDRVWRRDGTATAPRPFESMPLTYERAFGGGVRSRGGHAHPLNPHGRGLVVADDGARVRLPNLEWEDDRVRTWRCRPEVAGFAPMSGLLQPARVGRTPAIDWFPVAHPRLVFPAVSPGVAVSLRGVLRGETLRFTVPPPPARLAVVLGSQRHALALALDGVGILAEERIVRLHYRATFRYAVVRHLRRDAILEAA